MNKKMQLLFMLIIVLIATALIAQNTIEPVIPAKPSSINQESIKPLPARDFNRPHHHFCIPRRRTVISLDRYQENIDLNQKLKTSNEMLYREIK